MNEIFKIIDVINNLIDKIRFVSRQSVVVISNFLLLSNDYSCNKDDMSKKMVGNTIVEKSKDEYKLSFDFTSNDDNSSEFLTDDGQLSNGGNISLFDEMYLKNKEIIVNNAFALADKSLKISLQEKWNVVSDYLTDSYYAVAAGRFSDVKLEVVGGNYIIFTVMYESMLDGIYSNYKLSSEFVNTVFGNKYNFVVVTNDEWNRYKEDYINNIKSGKKYELMQLLEEKNDELVPAEQSAVDRLFDIVGEESIEFK